MMVDSWKKACDMGLQTQYRCPDHFGMYVYNDFFAYGMLDLIKRNVSTCTLIYALLMPDTACHLS